MIPPEAEFFKMTAGGNDFVLFDDRAGRLRGGDAGAAAGVATLRELTRGLCQRALSVGADGLILLATSSKADVRATFFNPDGGATFCGNGARCAARLAYLKGMAPARMTVETDLMVHHAEVSGSSVSFEMRAPQAFDDALEVTVGTEKLRGTYVDTGVPHVVLFRGVPPDASIDELGRALRHHPRFRPAGTNVNFIEKVEEGTLAIRTYERGVEGETLACGTGSVAAALAATAAGQVKSPVRLITRSGETIRVRFEGDPRRARGVRLEGEARLVYVGQLTEEAIRGASAAS
jgi:diaminopimelate epimerase